LPSSWAVSRQFDYLPGADGTDSQDITGPNRQDQQKEKERGTNTQKRTHVHSNMEVFGH